MKKPDTKSSCYMIPYIYRERVKRQVTLIKSVRNQGTLAGMDNALKE